jgi:hypothetical protein
MSPPQARQVNVAASQTGVAPPQLLRVGSHAPHRPLAALQKRPAPHSLSAWQARQVSVAALQIGLAALHQLDPIQAAAPVAEALAARRRGALAGQRVCGLFRCGGLSLSAIRRATTRPTTTHSSRSFF